MNTFHATRLIRASQGDVQGVLMDVENWGAWVDGLEDWGQPAPGEIRGVWSGPIQVGFHFSVRPMDAGVRLVMVESDLPLVELSGAWDPHPEGTTLTCTLTLEMGRTVPGVIWQEIEAELMPRFLLAVEARLRQLGKV